MPRCHGISESLQDKGNKLQESLIPKCFFFFFLKYTHIEWQIKITTDYQREENKDYPEHHNPNISPANLFSLLQGWNHAVLVKKKKKKGVKAVVLFHSGHTAIPWDSPNTPGTFVPHGLYTYCSFSMECSSSETPMTHSLTFFSSLLKCHLLQEGFLITQAEIIASLWHFSIPVFCFILLQCTARPEVLLQSS